MNTDIRLKTSFRDHRKRKKLQRKLGAEGVLAFIDLMLMAAQSRPDGVLIGMDQEDIALDANWEGEAKVLVDTLVSTGLLDILPDDIYAIHDWQDHNAYVANAPKRSEAARKAAQAKWDKKRNADRINPHCDSQETALRTARKGYAPSPSPSPEEEEGTERYVESNQSKDSSEADNPASEPSATPIITIPLVTKNGDNNPIEFPIYQQNIDEWQDAFPAVDIIQALKHCRQWNLDNPRKRKTKGGIRRHITAWLARDQDKAGSKAIRDPPRDGPPKPRGLSDEEVEKLQGQIQLDFGKE